MQTGVGPASPEGNVFRSPFPDVVVPDASFTEFVLARTGELGEKPALIDGPSGRVISYAGLAEAVRRTAAGSPPAVSGKATCSLSTAPTCPSTPWPFTLSPLLGV